MLGFLSITCENGRQVETYGVKGQEFCNMKLAFLCIVIFISCSVSVQAYPQFYTVLADTEDDSPVYSDPYRGWLWQKGDDYGDGDHADDVRKLPDFDFDLREILRGGKQALARKEDRDQRMRYYPKQRIREAYNQYLAKLNSRFDVPHPYRHRTPNNQMLDDVRPYPPENEDITFKDDDEDTTEEDQGRTPKKYIFDDETLEEKIAEANTRRYLEKMEKMLNKVEVGVNHEDVGHDGMNMEEEGSTEKDDFSTGSLQDVKFAEDKTDFAYAPPDPRFYVKQDRIGPQEHQHLRYNPLKAEWILVSPHRALRPWSGQIEKVAPNVVPKFDPTNPLCPGVKRSSGIVTPDYKSTYVFTNDFPALLEEGPEPEESDDPLFQVKTAKGTCRVICYHPHSDVYIDSLSNAQVVDIINEWIRQIDQLGEKYAWVQIFENRGASMGCSNPHPHCQIWASSFLPQEVKLKEENQLEYYKRHNRPLLFDYARKEIAKKERIVVENDDWLVVVPYWATWPFETMVLPKKLLQRFSQTSETQRKSLAEILKKLVVKYDNLFDCQFPYSMGWHGALTGDKNDVDQPHWTFHGTYLPPLLRSATVKKFMVGYELLAQSQRDLTAETAAAIRAAATGRHGSVSEADSEEENEEGDYTVYECPGLAPTGEMEVKNPMFQDDPTPAQTPHVKTNNSEEKN
ncbi:unnamed protein product [Brassicogethes aeneus]|uniref:Galactose-1-phosphate uridylyltransferase n=1 Tax=Brassicogethes aeneus TaxID=1431903 RepID=A0A9P0ARF0_BRAAE|nr:unnamed protein product [Brassicogethes aeneus]